MDIEQLSIFRNVLELKAFARGYIAAMPLSKFEEENDVWHSYSDEVDINFYTFNNTIKATAYKVIDSDIDTTQYETVYTEEIMIMSLLKERF